MPTEHEHPSRAVRNARLTLTPAAPVGEIDRRLFGSFVEHLGRCVYDGIYEPDHPSADAEGWRQDVLDLVRELGVTAVRYPGGNFVSGYRWEDGIGARGERPRRLDLAWHSIESNQVGIDEFASWAAKADAELIYAVNLGTRGIQEALDVLEYANVRAGTALADARVANGSVDPHCIRVWCLGNEMDGPWQLGHTTAQDYGRLAAQTARAMRQLDESLELVACGSSSAQMPTFGEWERVVLEETYDEVDFISCHAYYEPVDDDIDSFLSSAVDMDRFIDTVVATADHVKAVKGSDKTMMISFDEWNVWYRTHHMEVERITDIETWPVAPRLLEDSYSVLDAVVFGSLMNALLRHADRVRIACLAQLVNVIAPIMTEPGGIAWRQTTFYPFALTARLARTQVITTHIDAPLMATQAYGEVPVVDAVATWDAEGASLFLVNRDRHEAVALEVDVRELGDVAVVESHVLSDDDIHARNTREAPARVRPASLDGIRCADGRLVVTLPPCSWSAVALA